MTSFTIPTIATPRLTLRAARLEEFDTFAGFLASEHSRYMDGPVRATPPGPGSRATSPAGRCRASAG